MPTSGSITVLGFDPTSGGSAFRQRIGVVLQECGIDPYLTVAEVLALHASYYDHPRTVDEAIELVGLDEKRASRVKTLSGGQQRRLDVGARHHRRPRPALPRRTHHRLRSLCSPPGLGARPSTPRPRQDRAPHHPLHGRGPGARRPRHRDRGRRDPRHGEPRRHRRPRVGPHDHPDPMAGRRALDRAAAGGHPRWRTRGDRDRRRDRDAAHADHLGARRDDRSRRHHRDAPVPRGHLPPTRRATTDEAMPDPRPPGRATNSGRSGGTRRRRRSRSPFPLSSSWSSSRSTATRPSDSRAAR